MKNNINELQELKKEYNSKKEDLVLKKRIVKKWLKYPRYYKELEEVVELEDFTIQEEYQKISEEKIITKNEEELLELFEYRLQDLIYEWNVEYVFDNERNIISDFCEGLEEDEVEEVKKYEDIYYTLLEDTCISLVPTIDIEDIYRACEVTVEDLFEDYKEYVYIEDKVEEYIDIASIDYKKYSEKGYSLRSIKYEDLFDEVEELKRKSKIRSYNINNFTIQYLLHNEYLIFIEEEVEDQDSNNYYVGKKALEEGLEELKLLELKEKIHTLFYTQVNYYMDQEDIDLLNEEVEEGVVEVVYQDIDLEVISSMFIEGIAYNDINHIQGYIEKIKSLFNHGYYVLIKNEGGYNLYNLFI